MTLHPTSRAAAPDAPDDWRAHYWLRRAQGLGGGDRLIAWRLGPGADTGAVLANALALPGTLPELAEDFTLSDDGALQPVPAAAAPPVILSASHTGAALNALVAALTATDAAPPFRAGLAVTPADAVLALSVGRIAGDDTTLRRIVAVLAGAPVPARCHAGLPVLDRQPLEWMGSANGAAGGVGCCVLPRLETVEDAGLARHGAAALRAALTEMGCPADTAVAPLTEAAAAPFALAGPPLAPVIVALMPPEAPLLHAPAARRLAVPLLPDSAGPRIALALCAEGGQIRAALFCAPDRAPGLARLLVDRLARHWTAPPSLPQTAGPDIEALILAEFRAALAAPDMAADDDFFDRGGHSLTATRIVGRLDSQHGVRLRFEDIFAHPTARALAGRAACACRPAIPKAIPAPSPAAQAPLSLAQTSLWKVYAATGKGDIFNIPLALRFLDPVDEAAFAQAFRDLLVRHTILRSLFTEDASGRVSQRIVPEAELDRHHWFSRGSDGRAADARHVFDLARELPLRLRFSREDGLQVLSLLFHHIVLDEWSVGLLMDDLTCAYSARAAGRAPVWDTTPAIFSEFATAQAAAGPGAEHLAYWTESLRNAPQRRPFTAPGAAPAPAAAQRTDGGWVAIPVSRPVSAGLAETARMAGGSTFNVVYAAIAAALRAVSGRDDLVIGTSAAGRDDPAYFDTVGYFTTVVAHRLKLPPTATPLGLTSTVRDMINGSLPHDSIPIDLVEEALGCPGPEHLFEAFIQIHAGNRMNGTLRGADGTMIRYRQIDPEKSESLLGLQFEVVEDVIDGARDLRVMMSYRTDRYGADDVARLRAATLAMFGRFADPAARGRPIADGAP